MKEKFKVLLVGSGGREYAFLKKLLQALEVLVWVAPGLSGMLYFLTEEERSRVKLVPEVKANDLVGLLQLAKEIMPDLIIFGPEDPLIMGAADELQEAGFKVFGFTKQGAKLEGSKSWCKNIYQRCNLPTAEAALVNNVAMGEMYIREFEKAGQPIVLKCDGAAMGKGVIVVPLDHKDYWGETRRQLALMFDPQKPLGFKAEAVLLEHRYWMLNEWSAMSLVGKNGFWFPLLPTKDHKLFNGLNTGGMGIITPAPGFGLQDMADRRDKVQLVQKVLRDQYQTELCGIFYEGLNRMWDIDYLVEVNDRGGDPETQGQLEFLEGVPLHELLLASVEGRPDITQQVIIPQDKVIVGVVMASQGYPGAYSKGKRIFIPEKLPAPGLIHPAGLVWENGELATAGGRVLMAMGIGKDVVQARDHAYAIVASVKHENTLTWSKKIGF